MEAEASMPYKKALPYLLEKKGWSYRELDYRTRKSASYWNQTVRGDGSAPKNAAAYEMLAKIFGVRPGIFQEYYPLKAAEMVLRDPKLAYRVVTTAQKKGK